MERSKGESVERTDLSQLLTDPFLTDPFYTNTDILMGLGMSRLWAARTG
jgi:hypothetical protein